MCYDPVFDKIITSWDVIFLEDDFSINKRLVTDQSRDELTQLNIISNPIGIIEGVPIVQSCVPEQPSRSSGPTSSFGEMDDTLLNSDATNRDRFHIDS